MEIPNTPDGVKKLVAGAGTILLWVALGRVMWHANETRLGRRRFWSKNLLLEIPVAIGMSGVAWGAVEYFGLQSGQAAAIGVVIGWLGPRGVEELAKRLWPAKLHAAPDIRGAEAKQKDATP